MIVSRLQNFASLVAEKIGRETRLASVLRRWYELILVVLSKVRYECLTAWQLT